MQKRSKNISFAGVSRRRLNTEPEEASQVATPLARAQLIKLLSNPEAPNLFIFKLSDSSVNRFHTDKSIMNRSLQLHPKNLDTAGAAPDINMSPTRSPDFVRGDTAEDFSSAFIDANSPMRRRRGACLLDLSILQELRPKVYKTKEFAKKETLRRKSCYCTCCGGLSSLEKKTVHLTSPIAKREVTPTTTNGTKEVKGLIKPQKVLNNKTTLSGKNVSDLKNQNKNKKAAFVAFDEQQRQRSVSISSKTNNNNTGSRVLDNTFFDTETRNRTRSYNSRQDLKNLDNGMDSIVDFKEKSSIPFKKMKTDIIEDQNQQPLQQEDTLKRPLTSQINLLSRSESVPKIITTKAEPLSVKVTRVNTKKLPPGKARIIRSSLNAKSQSPSIFDRLALPKSHQNIESAPRSRATITESSLYSNSENPDEKTLDRNTVFTPPSESPLITLMTQRSSIASQRSKSVPNCGIPIQRRAISLPKLRISAPASNNNPNESSRFLILQRAQRDERVAFVQSRIENIKKLYFNSQRALSPEHSRELSREIEPQEPKMKAEKSLNKIIMSTRDFSSLQTSRAYLQRKKVQRTATERNLVPLQQIASVFPRHQSSKKKINEKIDYKNTRQI